MKYFKFTQISEETGISWAIAQPISGPTIPYSLLPGLTRIFNLHHDPMYYVGEASDEAQEDPDNFIFELTAEERAEELKKSVNSQIKERLSSLYQEEKDFRAQLFQKYHDTATLAGVYKYEEAKSIIADSEALAPTIRQEAEVRGVDPVVLANRIVENHEKFREEEAVIAGIRGLIFERLTNFVFDLQDADASIADFFSLEKIGENLKNEVVNGQMAEVTEDVRVNKYTLDMSQRYYFLI